MICGVNLEKFKEVLLLIEGQLHLVPEMEQRVPSFEAPIADTRANLAAQSLPATDSHWEFPAACTKRRNARNVNEQDSNNPFCAKQNIKHLVNNKPEELYQIQFHSE